MEILEKSVTFLEKGGVDSNSNPPPKKAKHRKRQVQTQYSVDQERGRESAKSQRELRVSVRKR